MSYNGVRCQKCPELTNHKSGLCTGCRTKPCAKCGKDFFWKRTPNDNCGDCGNFKPKRKTKVYE